MTKTVNLSIRMDADLKKEAEEIFSGFGMNFSTAVNAFARQTVRKQRLPFHIPRRKPSPKLLAAMEEAERIANDPNVKGFTSMEELIKDLQS